MAAKYGVEWQRREYSPEAFDASDLINQALSSANAALYGVVHSAIVGLGMSPGLGFVHEGHELSFVHDVADLYKEEISVPAAFEVVGLGMDDVTSVARRAVRDRVMEERLLQRTAGDLQDLWKLRRTRCRVPT